MKYYLLIFAVLLGWGESYGQKGRDSLFQVRLAAGAGWGFRISEITIPNNQIDVSTSCPAASLRLLWKPEHMLSVGIESGYLPITQVSSKAPLKPNEADGNANLSAIPILAVFSMEKYGFEAAAGIGVYQLMVSGKSNKGSIENSAIELGYMFSGSYVFRFSSRIGAGIDLKYFAFTDREIAMLIPQLSFRWALLAY